MIDLQEKRITVTGGSGFLGSHLIEELHNRGVPDELVFVPRSADYDLTRREAVERMYDDAQPDIVIHLAARVGGIGANRAHPGGFFYDNLQMGVELMEVGRLRELDKFVTIGTVCSYPKHTPVPFKEDSLWDGYPEETNAPYGIAKKALLVQGHAYRQEYGLNAIYLIVVNLYGPRDSFDLETSHVIPALIRKCLEARAVGRDHIVCWGDGSPTREFLFVEDAARAIAAATERYDGADPINIGSGQEISIKQLVELVAELTGFEGEIRWDTSKPNGQPRRCLDVGRAKELLGWSAESSLVDGLTRTVDAIRGSI